MEPDPAPAPPPPTERAYPYYAGWQAACCSVFFFGLIGSIGVALFPSGYEKFRAGQLPTGIALMIMGLFGIPTLVMSFLSLVAGVRDRLAPPVLRLTATALVLPPGARGAPPEDGDGQPLSTEPLHPAAIALAAVRWAKRDGPRFNSTLDIEYGGRAPFRVEQALMALVDFDDLEGALRAALPGAFAAAPPDSQTD